MFREILNKAIRNCGTQENLAVKLDMKPSSLTARIKNDTGWHETELDALFDIAEYCKSCDAIHKLEVRSLIETIKVIANHRDEQ